MTEINIESQLFDSLRYEINEGLTAVINKMMETCAEDGDVSAKISIALTQKPDVNGELIYVPVINWKVGTSVKLSESIKGGADTAGTHVKFDTRSCQFVLQQYGQQESLFED